MNKIGFELTFHLQVLPPQCVRIQKSYLFLWYSLYGCVITPILSVIFIIVQQTASIYNYLDKPAFTAGLSTKLIVITSEH